MIHACLWIWHSINSVCIMYLFKTKFSKKCDVMHSGTTLCQVWLFSYGIKNVYIRAAQNFGRLLGLGYLSGITFRVSFFFFIQRLTDSKLFNLIWWYCLWSSFPASLSSWESRWCSGSSLALCTTEPSFDRRSWGCKCIWFPVHTCFHRFFSGFSRFPPAYKPRLLK